MSWMSYPMLLSVKYASRLFFTHDLQWIGERPDDPWNDELSIIVILNHTSLWEPILLGGPENALLKQIATRGAVPVAAKTLERPVVGLFYRLVAPDVVPITGQRDRTWSEFKKHSAPGSLVVILPEGRMMRAGGLDKDGKPMTIRGGIADLIRNTPEGTMLIAYSGGLHHIQVPGQAFPKLFKTARMRFEMLDIPTYRDEVVERTGKKDFKLAVIADLTARRDEHCPTWE